MSGPPPSLAPSVRAFVRYGGGCKQKQVRNKAPLEQSHRRALLSVFRVDLSGLRCGSQRASTERAPGREAPRATRRYWTVDARGVAGRRGHSVPRAVQQHAPRNASVCGLLLVVLLMKGEREEARRCRRTHTSLVIARWPTASPQAARLHRGTERRTQIRHRNTHDENDSTRCDVLPYDA